MKLWYWGLRIDGHKFRLLFIHTHTGFKTRQAASPNFWRKIGRPLRRMSLPPPGGVWRSEGKEDLTGLNIQI